MKKKILSIAVVMILILLAVTTVSEAKMSMSIKNSIKEKLTNTDRVIKLGSVTIYGDGTQENSTVSVSVEEIDTIEINSDQETVDFLVSYSIKCDGIDDIGIILFFTQLNAQSLGENVVITTEKEDSNLIIEDVQITPGILTWEIIPLYYNTEPRFTDSDIGLGTAGVTKKVRNVHSRLHDFPLIQSLLKFPKILSLLT